MDHYFKICLIYQITMKSISTLAILFILLFCNNALHAQSDEFDITYQINQDNSVDFNYRKNLHGSYFLSVQFDQVTNCNQTYYKGYVTGYSGRAFSLKPKIQEQGIGFSFSYRYLRGKPNPKIKEDFVYQLPFEKGIKVKVNDVGYLGRQVGRGAPDTWKAFQFKTIKSEKILACRKGLVVKVVDQFGADTTKDYRFKDSMNEVMIEHKDGTFAHYSGFRSGSVKVKEGQWITPYTELGMSGRYDEENSYQIHFYIQYLSTRNIDDLDSPEKQMNAYSYINPLFYYKGGKAMLLPRNDYVADWTDEFIVKEFTRREKKKYTSPL